MQDALARRLPDPAPTTPYKKRLYQEPEPRDVGIDIVAITAAGMHFNLRRKENEAFTTSLYEIDRIISSLNHVDELNESVDKDQEAVKKALPQEY
jgi:hypothetical protein